VLVFAVVAGCGEGDGGSGKEAAFCMRVDKLCGAELTAKELGECRGDMTELKKPLGKHYDKLLSCGIEAKSCGEVLGCGAGAIEIVGEQVGEQVEAGYDKMLSKTKGKRSRSSADDDELPAECARFTDVCNPDERIAKSKCVEMIGNLRADPVNRKKLVACYAASKNCYEFTDCSTEMWFDLQ
jgi:hypothetical protein